MITVIQPVHCLNGSQPESVNKEILISSSYLGENDDNYLLYVVLPNCFNCFTTNLIYVYLCAYQHVSVAWCYSAVLITAIAILLTMKCTR